MILIKSKLNLNLNPQSSQAISINSKTFNPKPIKQSWILDINSCTAQLAASLPDRLLWTIPYRQFSSLCSKEISDSLLSILLLLSFQISFTSFVILMTRKPQEFYDIILRAFAGYSALFFALFPLFFSFSLLLLLLMT